MGEVKKYDLEKLNNFKYVESIGVTVEIDEDKTFEDRYELACYLFRQIPKDVLIELSHDIGFWSWLAACYIHQIAKPKKMRRYDHYILTKGRTENRHAISTPVKLLMDYGNDFARTILSRNIAEMGDMVEQVVSKQYIMRSPTFISLIVDLYSKKDELGEIFGSVSGASSKISKNKLKNGKRSKSGAGSVRRLTLEVKRLALNYKLDSMEEISVKELLNSEFSKYIYP